MLVSSFLSKSLDYFISKVFYSLSPLIAQKNAFIFRLKIFEVISQFGALIRTKIESTNSSHLSNFESLKAISASLTIIGQIAPDLLYRTGLVLIDASKHD